MRKKYFILPNSPVKIAGKLCEEYYFLSIHHFTCPVWIFDMTTNLIVDANKVALEFCGFSQDELIGLHIGRLWQDESLENILHELQYFTNGSTYFANIKHARKNNKAVDMRAQFTQVSAQKEFWEVLLIP